MTSPRDSKRQGKRLATRQDGFTLVEMMLVMALLVIVLAYAAPSLSRFFRARNLDSEARRFLALTRYAQSRAVSEGVPIELWINPKIGAYGLRAQTGYTDLDGKAVEFQLDPELEMAVPVQLLRTATNYWTLAPQVKGNQPAIWFLPDGYVSETSPDRVLIQQLRDQDAIWIVQETNRLRYEIQAGQPADTRR